jgi:hypothetical protein
MKHAYGLYACFRGGDEPGCESVLALALVLVLVLVRVGVGVGVAASAAAAGGLEMAAGGVCELVLVVWKPVLVLVLVWKRLPVWLEVGGGRGEVEGVRWQVVVG